VVFNPKTKTKLDPSNLDGILERKGHFLVFECKQAFEPLSRGQQILLQALAALPNWVVLVIELDGKLYNTGAQVFNPVQYARVTKNGIGEFKRTNLRAFSKLMEEWQSSVEKA
jgi:hypothetical protein